MRFFHGIGCASLGQRAMHGALRPLDAGAGGQRTGCGSMRFQSDAREKKVTIQKIVTIKKPSRPPSEGERHCDRASPEVVSHGVTVY